MLFLLAVAAMAAPADPGGTAVRFLEKVRAGNLNLEPGGDTALAPETGDIKRQEIARRLDRMARDIGKDPLESGTVNIDDDLAAVLVRNTAVSDPDKLQVFPVALVKRNGAWIAAPVPASFENSGLGYSTALRKRSAALQDWMLAQQARELADLRAQATAAMREEISRKLPAATLRMFTPAQAAECFLTACADGSLPELLGLLGGLSASPAEDWPLRARAAGRAVAPTARTMRPWRLLVSRDVLRAIVRHTEEQNSARFSIACLDPSSDMATLRSPQVELVNLDLSKTPEGYWRIDPPASFIQDLGKVENPQSGDENAEILDAFPAKLAGLYPFAPQATASQASQAVIHSLESSPLSALVPYICGAGDPQNARKSLIAAARIWWALRNPSSVCHVVPLATRVDEDKCAAIYQFFSCRNPDLSDLKILYFDRSTDGWLWTPQVPPETEKAFSKWTETETRHWKNHWQSVLLEDCIRLEHLPDPGAPASEEAARTLMQSWLAATRAGDLTSALRLTARLSAADSEAGLLRNLGYEMTDSRRNRNPPTITGIQRGLFWVAVGASTVSDSNTVFPFYPIINTPGGPRILLEVDLCAHGGRSRDFLNKTALERLRKTNPAAADELAKLFSNHRTKVMETTKP